MDVINNPSSPLFEIINKDSLNQICDDPFEWPWYGQLMKKPQTLAYICTLDFWMREYNVAVV